jgi:DNA polymerase, archaea type
MEFEKNTLLFGADPTPRIVAIELGETGTVKVYRREEDGSTVTDVEPFHPFVWCDSDVVDLGIESEKLEGSLKYGWLVTVDSWKELIALRNGLKKAGRDFFAFTDPVQHYLTATGRTLFTDLPFEALKRMQIEVLSFEGTVAGGGDPGRGNHIMSVALSDNTGWEELLIVDPENVEQSEHDALKCLTSFIKERDPDVIEGHDLFRFDLPYLVARAKKAKTKLDWGRSDGFLRS